MPPSSWGRTRKSQRNMAEDVPEKAVSSAGRACRVEIGRQAAGSSRFAPSQSATAVLLPRTEPRHALRWFFR